MVIDTNSTRGDCIVDLNTKNVYRLVRTGGPKATSVGTMYAFNLQNVESGKMRVTDDTRILLHNDKFRVPMGVLRRHFNLNLAPAASNEKVGPGMKDVVRRAAAPSHQQVQVWRALDILPSFSHPCFVPC